MHDAQPETNGLAARRAADEAQSLESLARETSTEVNLVKAIYAEELQSLEEKSTIRTFVSMLAMRRTRLILRSLGSKVLNTAEIH